MSTLHERLLARVGTGSQDRAEAALLAVVELHAPGPLVAEEPDEPPVCTLHTIECEDGGMTHLELWPCATIRAIAEALGIGETPK